MTKSKYEGGSGFAQSATLDRNPRVECYDDAGTDDGWRIVTLMPGWAFEDAAANEGDDPDSRMALHSKGFETVKAAVDRIRWAEPCKCGRCLAGKVLA
jgi:hypothetical protein